MSNKSMSVGVSSIVVGVLIASSACNSGGSEDTRLLVGQRDPMNDPGESSESSDAEDLGSSSGDEVEDPQTEGEESESTGEAPGGAAQEDGEPGQDVGGTSGEDGLPGDYGYETSSSTTGVEPDGVTDPYATDSYGGDPSPDCAHNLVVMGYWPPTNEMLRQWSANPAQNRGTWQGKNWRGLGYDIYAFFPEFPPDGDPSNDYFGADGWVGSPESDLRVDYQDTSADFWRIVDSYQPSIVVTTSRGGDIGWELEALEGGHYGGYADNPPFDWMGDEHGDSSYPDEGTIDARSWDGISRYRNGVTLPSQLPLDAIYQRTYELGLATVAVDYGTSGNYLSGFLGLHGLLYRELSGRSIAAGHIHVGTAVSPQDATSMMEATLEAVIAAKPPLECDRGV